MFCVSLLCFMLKINRKQKITSFILHIILISTFIKKANIKEQQPLESRKGESKEEQSKYLPTLTP